MIEITVLIEETSENPQLITEHGLSLLIKTKNHTILFDAGQTGRFTQNAKRLGIDLSVVDIAILSHAHYDHANGFPEFFKHNSHAPVYADKHVFGKCLSSDGRDIGACPELLNSGRLILTGDEYAIDGELTLFTGNELPRRHDMSAFGMKYANDGIVSEEKFFHEHYLKITDEAGCVLITGCSHKGILNILDWCSPAPRAVIGGFHFMSIRLNENGREYLCGAANHLNALPTDFYTCHCTGDPQYDFLAERMPRLNHIHAGDRVRL